MSKITLPFEVEEAEGKHEGDPFACTLYKMLPEPMQEQTKEAVYPLEYLHMIPVNQFGIPDTTRRCPGAWETWTRPT